jgi:hypothetical protein
MSNRLMLIALALFVIALAGCGGESPPPTPIPGNYFPLSTPTTWNYTTNLEVNTQSDTFFTTGTFTRHLVGKVPIHLYGGIIQAYEIDQTATTNALPVLTGSSSLPIVPAINALFSATGGLQPVKAYYVTSPATAQSPARVTFIAQAENGGPPVALPSPQDYLLNPPYDATSINVASWFVPMPLMPPMRDMSNLAVKDSVLEFSKIQGPAGLVNAVTDIYFYSANVTLGGLSGIINGRGHNFYLDTVGLGSGSGTVSDFAGTLTINGQQPALITSEITLVSVS